MLNQCVGQLTTQPSSMERARHLVHRATRLATIHCPSLALRHPCCPIYPRHPYLPKGAKEPGSDAQPSCRSPGFGEPRVLADRFQRNGVILDSAFRCLE
jgi:hypothetical protein